MQHKPCVFKNPSPSPQLSATKGQCLGWGFGRSNGTEGVRCLRESGGCAVWFDIALTPELDFTPELHTETRCFSGHLFPEIWTSGLWSSFGGDGCLSSTQGHDRSLSALLGNGLIWWGCWHLPEGEGWGYWLMMIRCCEELNKMISKVSSCSQTAVDVWLFSAYGIPTLFFSEELSRCSSWKEQHQKEQDHICITSIRTSRWSFICRWYQMRPTCTRQQA